MSARVELVQLHKLYPRAAAPSVELVDLVVEPGSLVALLGPSGCGKTTTLKMITGLIDTTRGDILFDGESIVGVPPERRRVAMVFQKPLLFAHMTVGENVAFGLRMQRVPRPVIREKVREMLELVHLEGYENREATQLSGGQEQRVSLARALVTEPDLLLLDEPLSQLDANLRIEMRDLILRIQRQLNLTTILVTHDQDEAVMLADRIALMFDGRIEQEDEPRMFYERPRTPRTARFFGVLNFIPGRVEGTSFVSAPGTFELQKECPPGESVLTIRQERIAIGPGPNSFLATVDRTMYLGTTLRVWATANGQEVQLMTSPTSAITAGDTVELRFPAEHLWVVRKEEIDG